MSSSSEEDVYPTCCETLEQKTKRIEKEKAKQFIRFGGENPYTMEDCRFGIDKMHKNLALPENMHPEVKQALVKNICLAVMEMCKLFESPKLETGLNKIISILFTTNDSFGYALLAGYTNNLFEFNKRIENILPTLQSPSPTNIKNLLQTHTPVLLNIESEPIETRFRRAIHVMTIGPDSAFYEVDSGCLRFMNNVDDKVVVGMPSEFLSHPPAILELRLENQWYWRSPYILRQYHRMHLSKQIEIVKFDEKSWEEGNEQGTAVLAEMKETVVGELDWY